MCGIYGYANIGTDTEKNTLKVADLKGITEFLTLSNLNRGKDSTGLAILDKNGRLFMSRKVKSADKFLSSTKVMSLLDQGISNETKYILGHTRFATHGKINKQNTQPFIYKNILGTHNGVIQNYKALFKSNKLKNFTTCDSEIIFAMLSKAKTDNDKAKILATLEGYYSIAFYDESEKSLYFAMGNNTLSIAMTKDRQHLFWSSDKAVMDDINKYFDNTMDYVPLDDYELIRINLSKETLNIDRYEILYYVTKYQPYYSGHSGFIGFDDDIQPIDDGLCDVCYSDKNVTYDNEFEYHICYDCKMRKE